MDPLMCCSIPPAPLMMPESLCGSQQSLFVTTICGRCGEFSENIHGKECVCARHRRIEVLCSAPKERPHNSNLQANLESLLSGWRLLQKFPRRKIQRTAPRGFQESEGSSRGVKYRKKKAPNRDIKPGQPGSCLVTEHNMIYGRKKRKASNSGDYNKIQKNLGEYHTGHSRSSTGCRIVPESQSPRRSATTS
ncbi:uncharacterized protein LOC143658263 [Tamandua tetradactyla]|uniref:uncharacterized protein LOC143658263 n=1 Tax=Tamandua tetradactyla TaxID=48850 RepID=UPI00405410D5